MKKTLLYIVAIVLLASCSNKVQVNEDFEIVKGNLKFGSELTLLFASEAPKLKMRPSGIENVKYNIASWNALSGEDLLAQVKRDDAQHGDGFDDSILSSSNEKRTANLFQAGINVKLEPEDISESGDTAFIHYKATEYAQIIAKVFEDDGQVCFKVEMQPLKKGYFSLAFMNAPSQTVDKVDEIWQPMIWQEKRFPERPYMTLAYRCPIPSALTTIEGTTYGVIAHPDEFPFQPLPLLDNSRFGIAVHNPDGEAQAMLFAPVLGGADSKMDTNESYTFTSILYAGKGNCTDNYETIAREFFNFHDYRQNDIGTLNETFENLNEYAMSDYAWFIDSLKGCAYSTDVPGAVKNVSSLNPLEIALVTDDLEMYEKRAYPTMEYQISREKFLFALDREQKIQHPSRKLNGPIAPVSELTSLYNIFGQNMPFLVGLAEESYKTSKIRNLDVEEAGDSWMNSMFMYKATGDDAYLQKAIADADAYIEARVMTPQTDFSDPMAGGFFFWTGFAPRWIYLLELYELSNEVRFLNAAQEGARYYTMFCWMSPKVPDEDILVNEGGKAPMYWYLNKKGHKQMYADEEMAPAWRLSEIGLTPESSGTSTGHRAIFMANYAPWMLRLGYYAEDSFLKEVAKSTIIGRYKNFPGYHINTARTTIYEKADYPLRPHKDLSVNSFHYNHIMPMASMLLDYLVTDAFVKSDGQVNFPSEFIEGYAYLQNKFYGHKPGSWYGEEAWLWMPPKLIETGSVELNNVSARNDNKLYVALSNQSGETIITWVKVNPELVSIQDGAEIKLTNGDVLTLEDGRIAVEVPAYGQVSLSFDGVIIHTKVQEQMLSAANAWTDDFVETEVGQAKAMIMNCGELTQNLYLYLEDDDDLVKSVQLIIKEEDEFKTFKDDAYPYEFTVPVSANEVEFQLKATGVNGEVQTSNWKKLNK
ncbi:glycoside hydrolase family protein [Carboxylicivirga marina]|uniref:Alpha-L-rhamnosidase six-hairpin glycosidase domain-containing protein n=1 Tax=Carboxylicivirga marina TaxID=2800988 RepID=A0ABS1HNJ3_9BACT|nr:hypothetical protein [Carboxylicivirga marina]MBK3519015.1 hypothetical protein [Carboxylicivirga marina]